MQPSPLFGDRRSKRIYPPPSTSPLFSNLPLNASTSRLSASRSARISPAAESAGSGACASPSASSATEGMPPPAAADPAPGTTIATESELERRAIAGPPDGGASMLPRLLPLPRGGGGGGPAVPPSRLPMRRDVASRLTTEGGRPDAAAPSLWRTEALRVGGGGGGS